VNRREWTDPTVPDAFKAAVVKALQANPYLSRFAADLVKQSA
jgi:hypothetical protein